MSNSKLFEKVILNNNVEVPSRLSIAPLTLFSSNPDGTINDEEREYLKLRGTNIGLYILGAAVVSQEGITAVSLPRCYDEKRDFSSLEERAKIIKSQGAFAINQIHHGGGLALKEYSELGPVVPSADVYPDKGYHELNDREIKKIIDNFLMLQNSL